MGEAASMGALILAGYSQEFSILSNGISVASQYLTPVLHATSVSVLWVANVIDCYKVEIIGVAAMILIAIALAYAISTLLTAVSGPVGAAFLMLVGLSLPSVASAAMTPSGTSCSCLEATPVNIKKVIAFSPMLTQQKTVSAGHIKALTNVLSTGGSLPPIWVDVNIIVDGNHRYVAGLLCNNPAEIQPWTASLTAPKYPVSALIVMP